MNTHVLRSVGAAALLLGLASASNATIIGFANSFGNNTTIAADLGSFATADIGGVTVSNGATPNIGVAFDSGWDYHHSANFDVVEAHTAAGAFDSDGDPDVAQTDFGHHTIGFSVDSGYAFILGSFDFGLSRETVGSETDWTFTLTNSLNETVWTQSVTLINGGSGDTRTIVPGFSGVDGEDYTLTFDLTAERGGTFGAGRNAVDNLSFGQRVVPAPAALALLGMGGLVGLRRRR